MFRETDVFRTSFYTTITLLYKHQPGTPKCYFESIFVQFYYDSCEVTILKT